ncbi:MAG: hypothetical protein AAFW46_15070, partial [Pseudomonadota bacterium]
MTSQSQGFFGSLRAKLVGLGVVALVLLSEAAVSVIDPLGFASATERVSAAIANRVMAPFYGYDPEQDRNIAASTRDIVVVLIRDEDVEALGSSWPLSYAAQSKVYRTILRYEPKLVFADLLYTFERGAEGGLDQLMSRLATD